MSIIKNVAFIIEIDNLIASWYFTCDTGDYLKHGKTYFFLEEIIINGNEKESSELLIFEKKENLLKEILRSDWAIEED